MSYADEVEAPFTTEELAANRRRLAAIRIEIEGRIAGYSLSGASRQAVLREIAGGLIVAAQKCGNR